MITPYFSNLVANIVLTCPKSQDTLYNLTFFNNLWKSSKTLLPFFPLNNNIHPQYGHSSAYPMGKHSPRPKFQVSSFKWTLKNGFFGIWV